MDNNKKILLSEVLTKPLLVIYTYILISVSQLFFDQTSITCPRCKMSSGHTRTHTHTHPLYISYTSTKYTHTHFTYVVPNLNS